MYCKQLPGWQIERIAYFEKHQFLQFCFLNPVIIFIYQLSFLSSLVHLYRDRRVVHRVATSGTTSYGVWQRVATNDDEWYSEDKEWQRMVKELTTSDREWQRMITNGNKWQWVTAIGKNKWKRHNTLQRTDDFLFSVTKTNTLFQGMDGCN